MGSTTTMCLFLLSSTAVCQEMMWERFGYFRGYPIGAAIYGPVAAVGDTDRDGYQDILVYVLSYEGSQLWLLSGRTGATLWKKYVFPYDPTTGTLGSMTCAGDMDRDGTLDYAVAAGGRYLGVPVGGIQVFGGRDDRLLWYHPGPVLPEGFGAGLTGGLDLDGDRRLDIVVGAPYADGDAGVVYALANDGRLLYRVGVPGYTWLGRSVARLGGDLDMDGIEDFVAGAPTTSYGGVLVLSGRTGALIRQGRGDLPSDLLGWSVAGCGDLDGDGMPDFAGGDSWGLVRVFSGRTGNPIHTWRWPSTSKFGWSVAGDGVDMDRDGVPDLVVGAPNEDNVPLGFGAQYVLSGRDGSVLFKLCCTPPGWSGNMGSYVAAVPPQPGNPYGLFVAIEPDYGPSFPSEMSSRIRLMRGTVPGSSTFGSPCRGSLAAAPRIGMRDRAPAKSGLRIHLSGAEAGAPALLLLGLSRTNFGSVPLPMPLDPFGFVGCLLHVAPDVGFPFSTGRAGNDAGHAGLDLPVTLSSTSGFEVFAQWIALGQGPTWPGGVSDAASFRMR
jgi:hypothetical protein